MLAGLAMGLIAAAAEARPAALYATGLTAPQGTINAPDGSLWGSDHVAGFCRYTDPTDAGPGRIDHPELASDTGPRTCLGGLRPQAGPGPDAAGAPTFLDPSPEFPNSGDELALIPDSSAPSSDVVRAQWNPDTARFEFKDTITLPGARIRPTSASVGPDGALYVAAIRTPDVFRVTNPDVGDAASAVIQVVARASDVRGPASVAAGYDELGALTLYMAEATGIREAHPNALLPPTASPSFGTGADTIGALGYDLGRHLLYAGTANAAAPGDEGVDRLRRFNTDTGAAEPAVADGFTGVGGVSLGLNGEVFVVDDAGILDPAGPEGLGLMFHVGRPVGRIVSGPTNAAGGQAANPAFTNDDTPTFTVAGDPTLECSLVAAGDPAAYSACPPDGSFTPAAPLATGATYRFAVRANDGTAIGIPDVRTFTVDTAAPDAPTIARPAEGATVGATPFFAFEPSDQGYSWECDLDGTGFAPCQPGRSFTFTSDGSHTLQVRATDRAGNVSPPSLVRNFSADGTIPTVAIDPLGPRTPDSTPLVSFSASEPGVQFGCKLDGEPFVLCNDGNDASSQSGSKQFGALPDGEHTVSVHARDAAGNLGPTQTLTFTIDTVAPTAAILSPGEGATTNEDVGVVLGADEPNVEFACQLDGAADFTPCAASHQLSALALGAHTYRVRATDDVGNVGPVAERNFSVSHTGAAEVQFDAPSPAENGETGAHPTFAFSGTTPAVASFRCAVDGAVPSACTSPQTLTLGTAGSHTFAVEAYDAGGNFLGRIERSFRAVDVTPPLVVIDSPAEGGRGRATTDVSFHAEDASAVAFQCSLDGGPFSACSSPKRYTGLSAGDHTVRIFGTDVFGNVGPEAARTFNVNSSGPGGINDTRGATIASLRVPATVTTATLRRGLPVTLRTRRGTRVVRLRIYKRVGRHRRKKVATIFRRTRPRGGTHRLRLRQGRRLKPGRYEIHAAAGASRTRLGATEVRSFGVRRR